MSAYAKAFKARQHARDVEAIFRALVEDNERRRQRGLPEFTPSYELAENIISNRSTKHATR